ncbi:hypothetical protein D3C86_2268790 [compost metagenome]
MRNAGNEGASDRRRPESSHSSQTWPLSLSSEISVISLRVVAMKSDGVRFNLRSISR